ncbi:MAG TPA: BON domain-containing protein [Longimicrobium sp.]|nr:BON domain-containing protein [Longimicrobium sp.]
MARYDDGYRRGGGPRGRGGYDGDVLPGGPNYDREAAAREAYTPGGFGPGWMQRTRGPGYGADFRPGQGGGALDRGGEGAPWDDEETLNGPARYGLGPYYRRLEKRRRPDDEVRKDVEEALFYDTWVDAESISVDVSDGVVTLRGALPDHDEIRYATDDAWEVEGVRGVRTELRVDSARRKPVDGVGERNRESGGREGGGNGGGRASQERTKSKEGGNG